MQNFQLTQSAQQVQYDLNLTENLEDAFDTTKTYAKDDMVIYQGALYKCTTAVSSAGAWTGSTNWTQIKLKDLSGGGTYYDIQITVGSGSYAGMYHDATGWHNYTATSNTPLTLNCDMLTANLSYGMQYDIIEIPLSNGDENLLIPTSNDAYIMYGPFL